MKKLSAALLLYLGLACAALAQTTFTMPPPGGVAVMGVQVVTTCNSVNITAPAIAFLAMDHTGALCTNASGGGGGGGTSSTFGAAFPATGTAMGFTDGTNMVAGRVRNPGSGAVIGDAAVVVVDANVLAAVTSATPAGTNLIGDVNLRQGGTALSLTNPTFFKQTDGTTAVVTDPCQGSTKSYLPITLATAAVKVIATGVAAKKIYVCSIDLTNNAADSIAVFEATTATVCATAAVAVVGAGTSVATAATGYNFAANGGISKGNGGYSIAQTSVNNNDLCIAQSAATQLTGGITYVTQ